MHEVEKKVLLYIENHLFQIVLALITILGILIRICIKDFVSQDAQYALLPWYEEIKKAGSIKALSEQVGNYNILYQFLIALMTYLPIKALYAYKILSCIFDFALAAVVAYFVYDITDGQRKWKALFAYAMVVCSPIVFLNSAAWAQCDSIYGFFIFMAMLYMFREKYIKSFVLLGISFAFKLQAVFILPFFLLVYFIKKKFSVLHFLIIPITMIISGLPAVFMGRGMFEPFKIYMEQSDTYKSLFLKYPSFWAVFCREDKVLQYDTFKTAAMLVTIAVLLMIMVIYILKKIPDNKENLISIAFILTYTCVLFLPAMHDRYGFVFEILAIVVLFINKKTLITIIPLWLTALCSYSVFLLHLETNMRILAIFNCATYVLYLYILFKNMFQNQKQKQLNN